VQRGVLGALGARERPHRVLNEATAHVEIDERRRHDDVGVAREDAPRVELAAGAQGAGRGAGLEHGAEGGDRGREPRGGHAAEGVRGGGGARVADEAGQQRVPGDGVPRGHFVEQAGRGAGEPGIGVRGEQGGGRDGGAEGGGLEQGSVDGC
jgi:hypothetical protein